MTKKHDTTVICAEYDRQTTRQLMQPQYLNALLIKFNTQRWPIWCKRLIERTWNKIVYRGIFILEGFIRSNRTGNEMKYFYCKNSVH